MIFRIRVFQDYVVTDEDALLRITAGLSPLPLDRAAEDIVRERFAKDARKKDFMDTAGVHMQLVSDAMKDIPF
jgi:hypothetical protein